MAVLAQDLRDAVLQAAMQGKLTKQLDTDSSVDELLDKIKLEKEQLIKDKVLKKQKALPRIEEDEIPFEIPDNWRWCYLGDLFMHNAGKALNSKNQNGILKEYITTSNVYEDHFELDNLKQMYYLENEIEKYSVKKNDLLVLEGGDAGRTSIWNLDISYCIQNHIHKLRPYVSDLNIKLYFYTLNFFKKIGLLKGKGVTIKGLSSNALHCILLPLPPIEEQQRIVDKVEELMKKIDEYEILENKLEELKKEFPNGMKDAIFQAAMEGKLTKQLDTDSSVDELIEKISNSRNLLISNKEIKQNKLSVSIEKIGDSYFEVSNVNGERKDITDNIPFDIPERWNWIKFGDLANLKIGKTPKRAVVENWKMDNNWVSISDMIENGYIKNTKEGVSNDSFKKDFKGIYSPKGTLLMSFKLTVGRVSILDIPAVHNEAIISVFPYFDINDICRDYLFKILPILSNYGDSKNAIKGKTLNSTSLYNLLIPLPPIEEQERIVEILEKLLPHCEM